MSSFRFDAAERRYFFKGRHLVNFLLPMLVMYVVGLMSPPITPPHRCGPGGKLLP